MVNHQGYAEFMKYKIIIPIILLSLFTLPAFAEEPSVGLRKNLGIDNAKKVLQGNNPTVIEDKTDFGEALERFRNASEERREALCENLEERVQNKLEKYSGRKDDHVEKYTQLYIKLVNISESLKAKGFDTSKLEQDIDTLDALVKDYAVAYAEFINGLQTAQNNVCGESEGSYKQALTNAREEHKEAMVIRAQIKEFYRSAIREDIKDLREQAVEMYQNLDSSN